jgi:hypothetical protein
MRRNKGLCALAPLLLAVGLLTEPAACCAVGGSSGPLTFSGMDCCEGPTPVCPPAMRNPASGISGSSIILGPVAATDILVATRLSPPSRPPSFSHDTSASTLSPSTLHLRRIALLI